MGNQMLIGLLVVVAALAIWVGVAMAELRRDLENERDLRRGQSDRFWELYSDSHEAFRVLGLTKAPKQDPQWTLPEPPAKRSR